jgi:hypothetical protein
MATPDQEVVKAIEEKQKGDRLLFDIISDSFTKQEV